jgi:hypothetical protein
MLLPFINLPPCDVSFFHNPKIEYVIQDERLKTNLWKSIAPVNTLINNHKINFIQVKDLVSEFFSELDTKNKQFSNILIQNLFDHFIKGARTL